MVKSTGCSSQRTLVQFPASTWQLITMSNSSSRGLVPSSDLCRYQACTQCRHACQQNTHTQKTKLIFKKKFTEVTWGRGLLETEPQGKGSTTELYTSAFFFANLGQGLTPLHRLAWNLQFTCLGLPHAAQTLACTPRFSSCHLTQNFLKHTTWGVRKEDSCALEASLG